MIKVIATLLLLIGLSSLCPAQTTLSEKVTRNIEARVDNGISPGIVVGIIDGDGVHYHSYGVKSLNGNEPVDEHSVFEIGSITKTFTGIILAELALKGKMNLDDPLEKYLSEGVTAPTRNGAFIKLVHLSNHTSSLPRMPDNFTPADPSNPYADYSEKQLYDFLEGHKLSRDVGSQYEYSNYAAGLLGHIMAKHQGMSYEELMIDVIAKPLKLGDTRITFTPNTKMNLAMGHHEGVQVKNWDLTTLAGAGGIRSTAVDMLKYVAANMGKVKSKLYPAMQLSHKNSRPEGSKPIVGLGWHILVADDIEIVWHNGGTGGYRAFAGFIKGGERGVVVLTNSTVSVDDIGIHLLNPRSPLADIKPSIGVKMRSIIDAQGLDTAVRSYSRFRNDHRDEYDFTEAQLNRLANEYLREGMIEKAIGVFMINATAYPESSDVYYGLGESFLKQGNEEKAIENYKKSVTFNPGNQQSIDVLKNLGVDVAEVVKEMIVNINTLERYIGKYELAPGFILTVSRDSSQLNAQATGQPQLPVYPKSQNVFYYKVVEAQLTFNQDEQGKVESVTLRQGGREIVGKKLEE